MPVFRWGHSWDAFQDLEREVDRLLESVNLTFHGIRPGRQFPAVNLYERPNEFLITAELPGTRADEIELTIAAGVLTLKGRRNGPEGISEERFRRHERFRGTWQRSLTLPERVQEEGLTADFNHGVLRVHLPKAPEAKSRQIPISEGGE